MPQISVIVPIYNVEDYLQRCIDSVLSQTLSDFELILVDDGSLDNCGIICDEYGAKDERIRVIHQKNGGVSNARNSALKMASGEYICFCDSDDFIKNDYLEKLCNSLEATKSDCVSCNFTLVDDNGEKEVYKWKSQEYCLGSSRIKEDFIKGIVSQDTIPWEIWGSLFRKSIIYDNDIRVCETCENFAEDLCFFLMYLAHCKKVVHIDYSGYYYYQRNNSMMANTEYDIKLNALNEVSFAFYNYLIKKRILNNMVNNYHLLHFWIMYDQYQKIVALNRYKTIPIECGKITKKKWYNKMISRFVYTYKEPLIINGVNRTFDYKNLCYYTVHKNYKFFCFLSGLYYKTIYKWRTK